MKNQKDQLLESFEIFEVMNKQKDSIFGGIVAPINCTQYETEYATHSGPDANTSVADGDMEEDPIN